MSSLVVVGTFIIVSLTILEGHKTEFTQMDNASNQLVKETQVNFIVSSSLEEMVKCCHAIAKAFLLTTMTISLNSAQQRSCV